MFASCMRMRWFIRCLQSIAVWICRAHCCLQSRPPSVTTVGVVEIIVCLRIYSGGSRPAGGSGTGRQKDIVRTGLCHRSPRREGSEEPTTFALRPELEKSVQALTSANCPWSYIHTVHTGLSVHRRHNVGAIVSQSETNKQRIRGMESSRIVIM